MSLPFTNPAHGRYDFPMKVMFDLDETVLIALKREAARRGRTMSNVVEAAVRAVLEPQLPPIPTFDSGGTLVDISDRDALDQATGSLEFWDG